jgi:hypothetical protein
MGLLGLKTVQVISDAYIELVGVNGQSGYYGTQLTGDIDGYL